MMACVGFDEMFRPNVSGQVLQNEQVASGVIYALSITWITANLGYFVWKKNRFARTKVRVAYFTINYYLADFCFLTGWVLPIAIGIENMPCWLSYVLIALSMGYFNATNFTRNSTFMLMTGLSYATQKNGRIPLDRIAEAEEAQSKLSLKERVVEEMSLIWFGLKFVFRPNSIKREKTHDEHVRMLVSLRYATSFRGATLFTTFCLLPYIALCVVMVASVPEYRENCRGCAPDNRGMVFTVVSLGGVLLAFAMMFNIKCSKLPDVFGVFFEETLSAGWIGIAFAALLVISFASVPNRYMLNLAIGIGLMIGFFFTTGFQILVAQRKERVRIQIASQSGTTSGGGNNKNNKASSVTHLESAGGLSANLASNMVFDIKASCPQLNDILLNPHLTRLLEIHVLREFGDENLNFLQNVAEWKTAFNDIAKSASAARAKKILNSFIRDGGLQQINLPYSIASKLIALADTPEAIFEETAFDAARIEIARLLESGAVARFVQSNEYKAIVSDQVVISAMAHDNA